MKKLSTLCPLFSLVLATSCSTNIHQISMTPPTNTFGQDWQFLQTHTDAILLQDGDAAIAIVPAYQGRVMTATAQGKKGASSGWINYEVVKKGVRPASETIGTLENHMYAFGGEERFWMGPEGGQYSIFFAPGTSFDFANWFTPDAIDNLPWTVTAQSKTSVTLEHRFALQNHSNTRFSIKATRIVELLSKNEIEKQLRLTLPASVQSVAYQSTNRVQNIGSEAWTEESGLLSIWMLCMFTPSPQTMVYIPYEQGSTEELGAIVNDEYFGKVSPDRLQVKDGLIRFTADGKSRGKIGLLPTRSQGIATSYDPLARRLTVLTFTQPKESRYVNSEWKLQDHPYAGDSINSYNDGPVDESGKQMGPFYELESSSPALALQPQEEGTHIQQIYHFYGNRPELENIFVTLTGKELP